MRILLLNDFRIGGGAEIIFQKTHEVLVKQGYDVCVMTLRFATDCLVLSTVACMQATHFF